MKTSDPKLADETIQDKFYRFPRRFLLKLSFAAVAFFLIAFLLHFSLADVIKGQLDVGLKQNPVCPIHFQRIKTSWLPPGLSLIAPQIPGSCFGNPKSALKLKNIFVGPAWPSLWPPGVGLKVLLQGAGSEIGLYPTVGFAKSVRIKNSRISTDLLNTLLGQGDILAGKLMLNAAVKLAGNKIGHGDFELNSKNLGLQAREIKAGILPFTLPALKFGQLALMAKLAGDTITIERLVLGKPAGTSIYARLKGELKIDQNSAQILNVTLDGELKIAQELIEDGPLAILKLLWQIDKQPNNKGIYKVRFSGPPQQAFVKPSFL